MRRHRTQKGYTLLEVLIVIAIISILAAMLMGAVMLLGDKGRKKLAEQDIRGLYAAFEQYKLKYGDYPEVVKAPPADYWRVDDSNAANGKFLAFLVKSGMFSFESGQVQDFTIGGTTVTKVFCDPWKQPYIFSRDKGNIPDKVDVNSTPKSGIYIYSAGGHYDVVNGNSNKSDLNKNEYKNDIAFAKDE